MTESSRIASTSLQKIALEVVQAYVPVSGLDPSTATIAEWERWHKAMQRLWIAVGRP